MRRERSLRTGVESQELLRVETDDQEPSLCWSYDVAFEPLNWKHDAAAPIPDFEARSPHS